MFRTFHCLRSQSLVLPSSASFADTFAASLKHQLALPFSQIADGYVVLVHAAALSVQVSNFHCLKLSILILFVLFVTNTFAVSHRHQQELLSAKLPMGGSFFHTGVLAFGNLERFTA